jgi:hypothetical protein
MNASPCIKLSYIKLQLKLKNKIIILTWTVEGWEGYNVNLFGIIHNLTEYSNTEIRYYQARAQGGKVPGAAY